MLDALHQGGRLAARNMPPDALRRASIVSEQLVRCLPQVHECCRLAERSAHWPSPDSLHDAVPKNEQAIRGSQLNASAYAFEGACLVCACVWVACAAQPSISFLPPRHRHSGLARAALQAREELASALHTSRDGCILEELTSINLRGLEMIAFPLSAGALSLELRWFAQLFQAGRHLLR